jgi:predicted sugar kinase
MGKYKEKKENAIIQKRRRAQQQAAGTVTQRALIMHVPTVSKVDAERYGAVYSDITALLWQL